LKVIVAEDGLASNGPHIKKLQQLNLRFILGAKHGDHTFLFNNLRYAVKEGRAREIECIDSEDRKKVHFFKFVNQVPLSKYLPAEPVAL
jgi:hypothetical protein